MMHTTRLPAIHDVVCFSDLAWGEMPARPHHLMSRFARRRRVFYIEEPVYDPVRTPSLKSEVCPRTGIHVITPQVPHGWPVDGLLAEFFGSAQIHRPIVWICNPEALDRLPAAVSPAVIVYDCGREAEGDGRILQAADLVFAADASVFHAKRRLHPRVQAFPDGVDLWHFLSARAPQEDPADQKELRHPRLGFVSSQAKLDLELLRGIAERRPEWQLIVAGARADLSLPNIHWLGNKAYQDLPRYFSGWDLAMMPLTLDATPGMTAEYLAAGLPVVATPVPDLVRRYGEMGLVRVASTVEDFVAEAEHAMLYGMSLKWRERADLFLESMDWDQPWNAVNQVIEKYLTGIGTFAPPPDLRPSHLTPAAH